jgi:hypothetical protein
MNYMHTFAELKAEMGRRLHAERMAIKQRAADMALEQQRAKKANQRKVAEQTEIFEMWCNNHRVKVIRKK